MSDENNHASERRFFRRTGFAAPVEVEILEPGDPDSTELREGSVVNVSLGGILVEVDEHLAEGTTCIVRLVDPDDGLFEAKGCVRRSRSAAGGIFVGIEFEGPIESAFREPSGDDHVAGLRLDAVNVLVVDDEPTILYLLHRFLTRRGCEVNTAASGEEALEALRETQPDVTVLDLRMPGMDGLDVLEAIRDEKLDAGRIWAISGYASDNEAREALRRGATDFINKPLDLKYLEWSMQLYRATR